MGERAKTIGLIAFVGFIVGVIIPLIFEAIPVEYFTYMATLIQIIPVKWIFSGLTGALLAVVIAVTWAYSTGKKDY